MSGGEETKNVDKENIHDVMNNCDIALARKRKCLSFKNQIRRRCLWSVKKIGLQFL